MAWLLETPGFHLKSSIQGYNKLSTICILINRLLDLESISKVKIIISSSKFHFRCILFHVLMFSENLGLDLGTRRTSVYLELTVLLNQSIRSWHNMLITIDRQADRQTGVRSRSRSRSGAGAIIFLIYFFVFARSRSRSFGRFLIEKHKGWSRSRSRSRSIFRPGSAPLDPAVEDFKPHLQGYVVGVVRYIYS